MISRQRVARAMNSQAGVARQLATSLLWVCSDSYRTDPAAGEWVDVASMAITRSVELAREI